MKQAHVPVAASFTVLFILAMLLATALFRSAQHRVMSTTQVSPTVAPLNETQKVYLETRVGTSELLFNISFAISGGLLALHFASKRRSPLHSHDGDLICLKARRARSSEGGPVHGDSNAS